MEEKNKTNKNTFTSKWLKHIKHLQSPFAVGIYITLLFIYLAANYYEIKRHTDSERQSKSLVNIAFDVVELLDLKSQDFRFRFRGSEVPQTPVALLAIDDRSIEEVGRWPWSREIIAEIISEMAKYGAKAIGFDIVFSEPQIDASLQALQRIETQIPNMPNEVRNIFDLEKQRKRPDEQLAETINQFRDRFVLGAFNDEGVSGSQEPYQDYCRNEAFRRANADKFVKLNATFIVDDTADPFVDLNFGKVFSNIFPHLEQVRTENKLKNYFHKKTLNDLTIREQRELQYFHDSENMEYCTRWLTENDEYLDPSKDIYLDIFSKSDLLKDQDLKSAVQNLKINTKWHPIVQQTRWTINIDKLQENADYTASFNAEQDSDGTIRNSSLFFRTGNRVGMSFVPSLALQTFLVATGYQARIEISQDQKIQNQKTISSFKIFDTSKEPEVLWANIPVDSQGRMKINYAGGRNTFPFLPAKELLNKKPTAKISRSIFDKNRKIWFTQETEVNKADFIKGRSFIFGATAIGVYDLRVTPYEKNFPGPETHVNTLSNFFQRNFIYTHPNEAKWMILTLVFFGILLSFLISQTGSVTGFLITLCSLILVFFVDTYLFKKEYIATMVLPFFLVSILYIFLTLYKYFTEERKKQHLRSTFSKYVSPAIVDEILKDPENIELGGKKETLTVFFSDVRGFTTISEKLDPQVLSDVLNRYLTPMTQIVFANKGTLDKYMGDAVMAFFGAPIPFPDHAKYACRCALQSLEKLKEIQEQFAKEGLPNIDIGIGINTSDMSVGNMGSDIVRNYTVMGDAVNLGSRLEGINKEYGTRIIISQFTYVEVKDSFTTREVDWVRVKGKNEPVRIFELINEGPVTEVRKDNLALFQEGFNLYHEKKFLEAKEKFQLALEKFPGDPVSELYIERCDEYLTEPPPEKWDGVFVMKTK